MKRLFLVILLVLLGASVYTWISQPQQQSARIILKWTTDPNPVRFEQMDLFHGWLVERGYTNKAGQAAVEVQIDTANNQSRVIQAVSGVGGDWIDGSPEYYAPMGVALDVTDVALKHGFSIGNTFPGAAPILQFNGGQYGFPCNICVVGMWCNATAFSKLGIDLPPEIWTPEQFETIGRKYVEAANRDGGRNRSFFCQSLVSGWQAELFGVAFLRSKGLDTYNETGTACILNDKRYVDLLNLLEKWRKDRLFPSAADANSMNSEEGYGGANLSLFQKGRYGIVVIGRWLLIRLRESPDAPDVKLVRFPMAEFQNMVLTARCASVYSGSRHQDYGKLFLEFLSSDVYNESVARTADALPPSRGFAVRALDVAGAVYPNEGDSFATGLKWANTIALANVPPVYLKGTGNNWIQYCKDKFMNGRCSADAAAKETQDRINARIDSTLNARPDLRAQYDRDCELQRRIDAKKAVGEKLPASWVLNPYYLKYYRAHGMIEEDL